MRKYILILLLCAAGMVQLRAQFTITAVQPPSNFVYEDLWHLTVTGPGSSNYNDFYISLRIYDDMGVLQVKSNSNIFTSSSLPLYVNKANLGPLPQFQTLYYDNTQLQAIVQNGGYFPVGIYNIQFVLMGKPTDGEYTELGEYTYQQMVEALWPPMLLTPYDEDTIYTIYPLLTWTPAYFASGGQQIVYELNLVELNENQNCYQGLTANPSKLFQQDLPATVLPYPSSASALEVGKKYGWQVVATINGEPVGYSQMWSFVVGSMGGLPDVMHEPYVELFPFPAPFIYRAWMGELRIKYVEEYVLPSAANTLQFKIYNWKGIVVMDNTSLTGITIAKGHNYKEIDVSTLVTSGPGATGPFLLEVYNHKNEKQYVRFIVEGIPEAEE